MKRNTAILYMPVLHQGYLNFLTSLPNDTWVFVLSESVLGALGERFDYVQRKDSLRAIDSRQMVAALRELKLFSSGDIFQLHENLLQNLLTQDQENLSVFCPDEDVSRAFMTKYLPKAQVTYRSIFLRWHRDNVEEEKAVSEHRSVDLTTFDKEMMAQAQLEASKSFDWWRQVGGVLVKDGAPVLYAHNTHVCNEQLPYVLGDPRSIFSRGVRLDLTTAEHAEVILISEAARQGIATKGAWMYVTTFPCPTCAALIARAGISRCYFGGGYAVLAGEAVLKDAGVELVLVKN